MTINADDVLRQMQQDPAFKKAVEERLEREGAAARLAGDLQALKDAFAAESEEMAKSLTAVTADRDAFHARAQQAEKGVGEVLLRQDLLCNVVDTLAQAVQHSNSRFDAMESLVKSLLATPQPSRAAVTPPAAAPTPGEAAPTAGEPEVIDLDPQEVMTKALKIDRARGKMKDAPTWKRLQAARNVSMAQLQSEWDAVVKDATREGISF